MAWVEPIAEWIEVAGVLVIILGGIAATLRFLGVAMRRRRAMIEIYASYRADLGRVILLGLEFLVAGDIIATVLVDRTLESAAALGIIVLIRTFLSFSLETEIDGVLPWQRNAQRAASHQQMSG